MLLLLHKTLKGSRIIQGFVLIRGVLLTLLTVFWEIFDVWRNSIAFKNNFLATLEMKNSILSEIMKSETIYVMKKVQKSTKSLILLFCWADLHLASEQITSQTFMLAQI